MASLVLASRPLLLLLLSLLIRSSDAQGWCGNSLLPQCSNSQFSGFSDLGAPLSNLSCTWCRSWTLASNIANKKLRMVGLDGGALRYDGNSSHNYMVEASLDNAFDLTDGTNWNLSLLPSFIPKVKGGELWSNPANSSVVAYGGHAADVNNVPSTATIPSLDSSNDQWTQQSTLFTIQRLTDGASVNVPRLGKAFYIGGYQDNRTSSSAPSDGLAHYATNMFELDTNKNSPSAIGAPFLPVQFGSASYLPAGDGDGVLIYFGGETPSQADIANCDNCSVNSWDHVWVYDIKGDKWYNQKTTGDVAPRTEFCSSTVYDDASKSWQIWAIGGADFNNKYVTDTVSILSIPSFQWFSAAPGAKLMSTSCEHVGPQTFVIGGRTEDTASGGEDYPAVAHIYDVNKQTTVTTFAPTSTVYTQPSSVRAAIATSSTPATWADPALPSLFMNRLGAAPSASAGAGSSSQGSSSDETTGLSGGAIGGIVVGVVVVIAAVIGLVTFFLLRRRKQKRAELGGQPGDDNRWVREKMELDANDTERTAMAEAPGESVRHEMSGSGWQHEMEAKTKKKESHETYELA